MDFPDDIPENSAPVAVIRRSGETSDQMSARHSGFSDEQTGFGMPRGGGALARSYQVAHDAAMQARADTRESGTQGRFDARQQLQQQEQALRVKQFQNQMDTHAAALSDAHAIADEHAAYINSISAAREKFGANTPDFYAAAWAAGAKAPNALAHDARLGEMQNFYGKALDASGAAPTLKTALWEVAQFDPTSNITPAQSRQYLGEIVAKYPEVAGDKRFVGLISSKLKDVNMLDVPAGDTVKQTVTGPNGTTVTTIPPAADKTVKQNPGALIDAAKIAASENAQYGTYNNKVFTPVEAGKGDQTHVRLIYQHPTAGTKEEIMPRAEYESQMNARKAAAAPASPAPVKWTRDEIGNPVPVK